jgi:hypothetical protein
MNMNITSQQMGLLLGVLNTLFTEGNYEAEQFSSILATDDLEELWELRGDIIDHLPPQDRF